MFGDQEWKDSQKMAEMSVAINHSQAVGWLVDRRMNETTIWEIGFSTICIYPLDGGKVLRKTSRVERVT